MKRTVTACAIAALVAACSTAASDGGDPSTTTPDVTVTSAATTTTTLERDPNGPEWARPGLEFLEALGSAVEAGDIEAALAFYHPDARLVMTEGSSAFGWRQIGDVIAQQTGRSNERDEVLIGDGLAAVLSAAPESCTDDYCPAASIDVFWIWDGAIGIQLHSGGTPLASDDPLLDLYVGSAEAYSAHDLEGLRAFYSDAVFAPPFPTEEYETLFGAFPQLEARPLTLSDLGLSDSDRPALFDLGSAWSDSSRGRAGVGIYDVTFAPGVSSVAASLWRLWDGQIVEAATMFDPSGWDRMLELAGLEPPPAWFTSIRTPEPHIVERTHVVEVSDGTEIELYDATDAVADVLKWSLGRFASAGLEVPHVDAVYLETERSCLEESAWTFLGSDSAIVRLCLDATDLEDGDDVTLAGRFTMLHELAHVWTAEYTSPEQRAAFTSLRGLATWNDASAPWSERGNEQASEVIAWGLTEQPVALVRIGSPTCTELEVAFHALTGAEPLHGCG